MSVQWNYVRGLWYPNTAYNNALLNQGRVGELQGGVVDPKRLPATYRLPTYTIPKAAVISTPVERNNYGYATNYVVKNRGYESLGSRGYRYWDYSTL